MKLLIGSDTYYPDVNGASYFTQRFAAGLRARGHDVHVVCPSRSIHPALTCRGGIMLHRIPSVPIPGQGGFRFAPPLFAYQRMLREVRRVQPDLIHVQGHFFIGRALVRVARRLRIPIIATNHFMPDNLVFYLHLPECIEQLVTEWAWRDFARIFNQVATITTPTPIAAQLIKDKGIIRPVTPISNGIDLAVFNPRVAGAEVRAKYAIPDRPTYMYVGRLDKEKHIDELIRALPIVRQAVDAQFVLVGSGKQATQLAQLARQARMREYVTFTGFIPDQELPKAYALCNVFCNAGIAELQSIATMEAMATGKPVIAANAVALPHLVHHGVNGYTFDPGDTKALATHLIELLSDSRKRRAMGQKSLELIAPHALPRSLAAYESVYTLAIAKMGRQSSAFGSVPRPAGRSSFEHE